MISKTYRFKTWTIITRSKDPAIVCANHAVTKSDIVISNTEVTVCKTCFKN